MLKISIRFIDGSYQEFEESDSIFAKLMALRKSGFEGKGLIHELLTDDWGPPPLSVRIEGILGNSTVVDEYIPYS